MNAPDLDHLRPVTVLTGFLGSGKTTTLARLLKAPEFAGTVAIINEFGEIGLDHLLIETSQERFALLDNGCVCCTVRDDLVEWKESFETFRGEVDKLSREGVSLEVAAERIAPLELPGWGPTPLKFRALEGLLQELR